MVLEMVKRALRKCDFSPSLYILLEKNEVMKLKENGTGVFLLGMSEVLLVEEALFCLIYM